MPLDPQARLFLDLTAAAGFVAPSTLSVEAARAQMARRRTIVSASPEHVDRVHERTIPGPAGDIPVRIYAPSDNPLPVLVYFHGGGWVIGDLDSHDHVCRALANRADCVVISVHYRLAPEHVYPAAAEDAYAAVCWVGAHAAAIGADASRIAVGGDSAGGNLSAVASQMLRERGGPRLSLQVLVYPVTDSNLDTESYRRCADGYGMTRGDMVWFWDSYVPNAADRINPYCAPLRAADLSRLPPALVITAEHDTLRDEGEAYAARLKAAGVPTTLTRDEGQIHGFVGLFGLIDRGKDGLGQIAGTLRAAFAAR